MIDTDKPLPSREATPRVEDAPPSAGFHPVKWALAELTNEPVGTSILLEGKDAKRFRHYAHLGKFDRAWEGDSLRVWNVGTPAAPAPVPVIVTPGSTVDLAAENEALRRRIAELEARDTSVFAEAPLLPAPDALMSDYGPVDPKDAETIIEGFTEELRTSRDTAEGTMRSMDPPDRRRLFSILNTELGRLKNQEALLGKSIPRRADCEELIGILAKVGEA